MPVLTALSQFEQYDLETEVCDAVGCQRASASKIVAEVFVPELEKRLRTARATALDAAIVDLERADRIGNTPIDDVTPDDLAWIRHPDQRPIAGIDVLSPSKVRQAIVGWLRAAALRSTR